MDKITRKSDFKGQLKAKIKKNQNQWLFAKGVRIQGPNSIKNKGEIKKKIEVWRLIRDEIKTTQNQGPRLKKKSTKHINTGHHFKTWQSWN
jgi:hypothetical protein